MPYTTTLKAENKHQEIAHFQNQFIIQRKTLEDLTQRLQQNKHLAYLQSTDHNGKMDNRLLTDINTIEQEVHTFGDCLINCVSVQKVGVHPNFLNTFF